MIEYNDCIALGNSKEGLEFDMTLEEFSNAMLKRGKKNPSSVKLRWRCTKNSNHVWKKGYSLIKFGYGCPRCREISYGDCVELGNSRSDLDFDMNRDEYDSLMYNRKNTSPSKVMLRWRCTNITRHVWNKDYSQIKIGYSCPYCREINYEDCIQLADSRDDLKFDMTREEFNTAILKRGNVPPSRVKTRWRCTKNTNHKWLSHYRNIADGKGCPRCRETSYDDCVFLGDSRNDLEFNMSLDEFEIAMRTRGKNPPNKVKIKWRCKENSDHIWKASYNSIQRGRGCPDCVETYGLMGKYLHRALQYLTTMFFMQKCIKVYSEVIVSRNLKRNNYKIDALLLNSPDNNYLFKRLVNYPKIILKLRLNDYSLRQIKAFLFDYTSDLSYDNIKGKVSKYQKDDMILFIVGTRWKGRIKDSFKQIIETKYSNIIIIKYDIFAELIGLNGEFLRLFNYAFDLYHSFDLVDLKEFVEDICHQYHQKYKRDLFHTMDLVFDMHKMNLDYKSSFKL